MEDYSSNEKVKPEKQRRNMFSVCIYISICVIIYLYSFIKICLPKLLLEMPI